MNMKLHRIWYKFGYPIARIFFGMAVKKYSFKTDIMKEKKDWPYIVVANHTTESDMIMLAYAFKKPMYYVCGEHLLRSKWGGVIKTLANPIPEYKGAVATATVREIMRRVREGDNIMIFPEGSRSFNGETIPVADSMGKLIKHCKCGLITYKLTGGYFVAPRWGYKFRTGPVSGAIINTYSPDDLAAMKPREIAGLINKDIYENAYETQRANPQKYVCDVPAEGIENYLLICPKCGSYDSMESKGDTFRCKCCGTGAKYTDTGFLEGDFGFDSVYDWGKWMETRFDEDMEKKADDELLFTDTEVKLYKVTLDHKQVDIGFGDLKIYKDRLEYGDFVFPFAELPAVNELYFGKTFLFTYESEYYGLTGEHFHAWKCERLYNLYNSKAKKA